MRTILRHFGRPRVLLPVVHCVDPAQAQCAAVVALENGADGLWFIDQGGMAWCDVLTIAKAAVRASVPFVGVNILALDPDDVVREISGEPISVWADDGGIDLARPDLTRCEARSFRDVCGEIYWRGLFFGGVAFKYQADVPAAHLGTAVRLAVECGVDVVTTSGPATGQPPSVDKIAAMRAWIGDAGLAIASGVTSENVEPFLPLVDAFLVASGIESSFGVFDPGRVRRLADAIHGEGDAR